MSSMLIYYNMDHSSFLPCLFLTSQSNSEKVVPTTIHLLNCFPWGYGLRILILLHMCTGIKQLSKCMTDLDWDKKDVRWEDEQEPFVVDRKYSFCRKEVLKKQKRTCTHNDRVCQRDTGTNWKSLNGQIWKNLKKKHNVVLDYNSKYKVNIHESTLILKNDWINK